MAFGDFEHFGTPLLQVTRCPYLSINLYCRKDNRFRTPCLTKPLLLHKIRLKGQVTRHLYRTSVNLTNVNLISRDFCILKNLNWKNESRKNGSRLKQRICSMFLEIKTETAKCSRESEAAYLKQSV